MARGRAHVEQQRCARASREALEAGGIPLAAAERLEEFRRRGGGFFTSDLSVNELALLRGTGFRPLTQVMGTCFYRTPWPNYPWSAGDGEGRTFELEQQTRGWNEARRLAVGRLSAEARGAGADAVVGVRLIRRQREWAVSLIEFVVIGTAVRSERYDLGDEPALSNLSGQEFNKLFRYGFWPVGPVAASPVPYVAEMPDYTRGVYDARALAMERLTAQAQDAGADGVVGVTIDRSQRLLERRGSATAFTDLIIEMHVLGTAVIELERDEAPPRSEFGLQLNDQEAT
jgi:uncharacterized protein YbjQ (UPF0145 family)